MDTMTMQPTGQAVESALNALIAAKVQEALSTAGTHAGTPRGSGEVRFTARERKIQSKDLIALAEAACPAWSRPDFSARRWIESAEEACYKLREANPESALAFLLRKGVQTLANDWYIVAEREWDGYCGVNSSDNFAEWYAPIYPSTIAGRVPRGDRFPEGKVFGEDSVMVNQKFGLIEGFDRELFDDDQTGQIKQRAARLGQGMAVTENAYAAIRFIGAAGSYANLVVPASNYTTLDINQSVVSGPFSATLHGTYGNRPGTFAALGLTMLKQAWSDLLVAKDPQGNKIIVKPDVLVVSAKDDLHAKLLVSPPGGVPYYPAIPGQSGSVMGGGSVATAATQGALAGYPGGVFGANPFMGLGIRVVVSRYLPDWAWALGQKGRGFIFQERDALEVVQESTTAGQAFEMDAYRFRSRRRFEVDWVGGGSRFFFLGNSGEVAGSF
jgi:hypothetical protein